jgi:hypothetical protein
MQSQMLEFSAGHLPMLINNCGVTDMEFDLMKLGLGVQGAIVEANKKATVHPIPTSLNIKYMASQAIKRPIRTPHEMRKGRELKIFTVIDDNNGPEAA